MSGKKGAVQISGVAFAAGLVIAAIVIALFAYFVFRVTSETKEDVAMSNFNKLAEDIDKLLKESESELWADRTVGAYQLPEDYVLVAFPRSKNSIIYIDPDGQGVPAMRKPCRETGCLCLYKRSNFNPNKPVDFSVCKNFAVDFMTARPREDKFLVANSKGDNFYKVHGPNYFERILGFNFVYHSYLVLFDVVEEPDEIEFGVQQVYLQKLKTDDGILVLIQPSGQWLKKIVEGRLKNATYLKILNENWDKIQFRKIYLEQYAEVAPGEVLESPVLIHLRKGNLFKLAYSEKVGFDGFYWVFGFGRPTFWLVDNHDEVVGEERLLELSDGEMEKLLTDALNCVESQRTWDAEQKKCVGDIPPKILEVSKLYDDAIKAYNDQKYDEAIEKFSEFEKKYPDDERIPRVLYFLGWCHFRKLEKSLQPSIDYAVTSLSAAKRDHPNLYADFLKAFEKWKILNQEKYYDANINLVTKIYRETDKYFKCADPKLGRLACHLSWANFHQRCWFWDRDWPNSDQCLPCKYLIDPERRMYKSVCDESPCSRPGFEKTYWRDVESKCVMDISKFYCSDYSEEQCMNDPCVRLGECCHLENQMSGKYVIGTECKGG